VFLLPNDATEDLTSGEGSYLLNGGIGEEFRNPESKYGVQVLDLSRFRLGNANRSTELSSILLMEKIFSIVEIFSSEGVGTY